jgi:hypothetical protein
MVTSLSLFNLRRANSKCWWNAVLSFIDSFENLTIILSKDFLSRITLLLAQANLAATVLCISIVMPPRGQEYSVVRAQELYDDLARLLALLPNVYIAEFARLGV